MQALPGTEHVTAARTWLDLLGAADAAPAPCHAELIAADIVAVYVPHRSGLSPAEPPPPPTSIRRLVDAGIISLLSPSAPAVECSASTRMLQARVEATARDSEATTSPLNVQCVPLDHVMAALPPALQSQRLADSSFMLTAHIAPVMVASSAGAEAGRLTSFRTRMQLPPALRLETTAPLALVRPGSSHTVEVRWTGAAVPASTTNERTLGYVLARVILPLGVTEMPAAAIWQELTVVPAAATLPGVAPGATSLPPPPPPGTAAATRRRWMEARASRQAPLPAVAKQLPAGPGVALVGMPTGATVAFRVAAVTASGIGCWSPPSPLLAMPLDDGSAAGLAGRSSISPGGARYRTTALLSPAGLVKQLTTVGAGNQSAGASSVKVAATTADGDNVTTRRLSSRWTAGQSAFAWEAYLLAPLPPAGAVADATPDAIDALASIAAFHTALAVVYATIAGNASERGCTSLPAATTGAAAGATQLPPLTAAIFCLSTPPATGLVTALHGLLERSGATTDLLHSLRRWLTAVPLVTPALTPADEADAAAAALAQAAVFWLGAVNATGRPLPGARQSCDAGLEEIAQLTRSFDDTTLAGVGGLPAYAAVREQRVRWLVSHRAACGNTASARLLPRQAHTADTMLASPAYTRLAALAAAAGPHALAAFIHDSADAIVRGRSA